MPMPTLIAKKYITAATARFVHEKKNNATIAPMWKIVMAMAVIQLIRPS